MTKVLAMYLPQFHNIPENDIWWGKGFTEWTAVRKSKPLFEGHYIPRQPLNGYYNLMARPTMEWQAKLMHEYGVDGMCFYHYYFKDGRKVLEKPAENLLEWKDINMPFCFSWANETWARSWAKLSSKNVWAIDKEQETDNNGILLEQGYGNQEDWIEHFEYLLPFFKDERYIKVDGKPVFMIYKPDEIFCINAMIKVWNGLARENKLPGIFFISCNTDIEVCDAVVNMEPQYTLLRNYKKQQSNKLNNGPSLMDYGTVVKNSLDNQLRVGKTTKKTYYSVFPSYDDTPRRGTAGIVVDKIRPEIFREYLLKTLINSEKNGNEFVFINAWNEWGESMYLEPDYHYEYKWLEGVKEAISLSCVFNESVIQEEDIEQKLMREDVLTRYRSYWKTFDNWMLLKDRNISLVEYFKKYHIKNIAVYGMGMFFNHFYSEIQDSFVNIEYGIDIRAGSIKNEFPVYSAEDVFSEVECVVVTVTYGCDEIYQMLREKGMKNIVLLTEIIGELLEADQSGKGIIDE